MDIPPDIQLKTTIRAGSVYRFISEDFSSREPHWFIVANINPLNDTLILLTCITSKVDKRKEHAFNSGLSPDTLVEIGPDDYNELELPSIIDCNSPSETTKEKLISRLEKNELRITKTVYLNVCIYISTCLSRAVPVHVPCCANCIQILQDLIE